ncbi:hypothetical protein B5M09_007551 [Aphanomyces astaci]|uniref:Uncharacterized protein n=1 Tax=Aphanomyces astaci TaxID=112090 RepID=A0A3R7WPF2_APHAT|nr:hypothetical protein B5M09_007551 [Aphanomyces astaci]
MSRSGCSPYFVQKDAENDIWSSWSSAFFNFEKHGTRWAPRNPAMGETLAHRQQTLVCSVVGGLVPELQTTYAGRRPCPPGEASFLFRAVAKYLAFLVSQVCHVDRAIPSMAQMAQAERGEFSYARRSLILSPRL